MGANDVATAETALLAGIEDALRRAVSREEGLVGVTGILLRRAIDEVIDAPRTGRLILDECEKTEKTYLGTKVEILFRAAVGQPKGQSLDMRVGEIDVDIKHSIRKSWMIPREALGKVCLLISENERKATFRMGLLVCSIENLTAGANRDKKLQVSAEGSRQVRWIAYDEPYPRNFWEGFDRKRLEQIRSHKGGSQRLAELFRLLLGMPIPRSAITAVAAQLDPLKRIRANGGARDILRPEGVAILWGQNDRQLVAALGLPPLLDDEFISIRPTNDHQRLLLVASGKL